MEEVGSLTQGFVLLAKYYQQLAARVSALYLSAILAIWMSCRKAHGGLCEGS